MTSDNHELRKVGLKITLPRTKIFKLLEALSSKKEHVSAEDIYRYLLDSGESIGLPTVYRVLAQFESAGLVERRHLIKGRSVFELAKEDHHDHIVCLDSSEIIEFRDHIIECRQQEIARQHNFELVDHALVLYVKKMISKNIRV